MKTIRLNNIYKYAKATLESRNMIEGQAVLNSGNLLLCGISESSQDQFELYCLCMHSSTISSDPHEITGILAMNGALSGDLHIKKMVCSCKAGLGQACKHIVAVLLYCTQ